MIVSHSRTSLDRNSWQLSRVIFTEVPVVGALLLLPIDRNLGRVHVQHSSVRRTQRFCLADQFPVQSCQPGEVPLLSQQFRLEDSVSQVRSHMA